MADYLMDKGENEFVRVCEIGCFIAKTIPEALAEMWAIADGCKAKDFLYHTSINPRPGVTLSEKQVKESVDTLGKNLGLAGHQRVVVEHVKNGRAHYHVVWNRVDPKTGIVKKLSFDRRKLRATALELGDRFGLMPTTNKGQSFKRGDIERGKRTGIDPKIVKAEVTALWNQSKSGKEFIAYLAEHGYILAKGNKGQYVLIDSAGSIHGLTRRIDGATAKTVKRGLADIDSQTLPTIADAKSRIKGRLPKYAAKRKLAAKGKSGKLHRKIHIYKKSAGTRKRTSSNARWRPYGFFLTTRHATSRSNPRMPAGAAGKNQATAGIAKPNIIQSHAITNHPSPPINGKSQTDAAGLPQEKFGQPPTGINPNVVSDGSITPFAASDAGKPSSTGAVSSDHGAVTSNSPALPPDARLFPAIWKPEFGTAEKKPEHYAAPFRPATHGGMSEAQRIDYEAAYDGKITWAEYFKKWG